MEVTQIEMNYEERIKELIQKIKEKDETIHNQTLELRQLRNKVGELEDRLMRMYVS